MQSDQQDVSSTGRLVPPPRKLSVFMAQEFLYEYAQGRLSGERKRSVETALNENEVLRKDLETIQLAQNYLEKLSKTTVTPAHMGELKNVRPTVANVIEQLRWKKWPQWLRWTTEALTMSVAVAIIAIALPWDQLKIQFFSADTKSAISQSDPEIIDSSHERFLQITNDKLNQANEQKTQTKN